jgi:hypothetical protein
MGEDEEPKKQRRPTHRTQWAAQFAVASELCKRNYQVALTLGNHPMIDLMVISPKHEQFLVDVKGLHSKNFWPVRQRRKAGPASGDVVQRLFYVFVLVPDKADEPNRFFILTEEQVNEGIEIDWERAKERRKARGLSGDPGDFKGVEWDFAKDYQDKWRALPEQDAPYFTG